MLVNGQKLVRYDGEWLREEWRDIVGYEGSYIVSSYGRIESLDRVNNIGRKVYGRAMKFNPNRKGYLLVCLHKDGKQETKAVHSIVAEAFLGHTPDGTTRICVDHIDNDRLNNMADNFQLISNRENCTKDKKGCASKYIGVSWHKTAKRWRARIKINGKEKSLGCFDSELEASIAYQDALSQLNTPPIVS